MKAVALIAAVFAATAAAQLDQLPDCAKGCVGQFTSGQNIGDCKQLDAKCICSSNSFLDNIACCLAAACNQADQQAAVRFATQFCSTQGVTVPSAVSCRSATPSSTAAAASSSNAATASTTGGSASTTSASAAAGTTSSASRNMGPAGAGSGSGLGVLGGLFAALAFL